MPLRASRLSPMNSVRLGTVQVLGHGDILHYGTGTWPRTWTDFAPLYHRARGVASGPEPGGLIPVRCEQDAGGHL